MTRLPKPPDPVDFQFRQGYGGQNHFPSRVGIWCILEAVVEFHRIAVPQSGHRDTPAALTKAP